MNDQGVAVDFEMIEAVDRPFGEAVAVEEREPISGFHILFLALTAERNR